MNYKKKFRNSLREIETPLPDRVLGASAKGNRNDKKKKLFRKISLTPALSVFLCIVLVGCTAAVGIPILINYMNARALTDNLEQLKTVPEGYVGIYTAEDLDNIRNSPESNYILMNDIDFSDTDFLEGGRFEGGFVPIGSEQSEDESPAFSGIFNGNGYVIKNVKIAPATRVGKPNFGIFGMTNGQFINLGVEGIEINVGFSEADFYTDDEMIDVFVGGIAANADFVGGCYVKGATINISLENYFHGGEWEYKPYRRDGKPMLLVGGVAGASDYIDSCIADADISVTGEKDFTVSAGLLSGDAFSAITSITSGKLSVDGSKCVSVSVDRISSLSGGVSMPSILSETAMETIVEKIEKYYNEEGNSEWNSALFRAYYLKHSASHEDPSKPDTRRLYKEYMEINKMFGYVNIDDANYDGDLYILDKHIVGTDAVHISKIVGEVFGSFDAFLDFCNENDIKCGIVNCYSFDSEENIDVSKLERFDFEKIFIEENGEVKLRIFDR